MLVLMRSFSYTPDANFNDGFLLHSSGYVWGGVYHMLLMLMLLMSFSYTSEAVFGEVFIICS